MDFLRNNMIPRVNTAAQGAPPMAHTLQDATPPQGAYPPSTPTRGRTLEGKSKHSLSPPKTNGRKYYSPLDSQDEDMEQCQKSPTPIERHRRIDSTIAIPSSPDVLNAPSTVHVSSTVHAPSTVHASSTVHAPLTMHAPFTMHAPSTVHAPSTAHAASTMRASSDKRRMAKNKKRSTLNITSGSKQAEATSRINSIAEIQSSIKQALDRLYLLVPSNEKDLATGFDYIRKACGENIEPNQTMLTTWQGQMNDKLNVMMQAIEVNNTSIGSIAKQLGPDSTIHASVRKETQTPQLANTHVEPKLSYAQHAAKNGPNEVNLSSNGAPWQTVSRKVAPQSTASTFRDRRVIITPEADFNIVNYMEVRNQVNTALRKAGSKVMISQVAKTQRGKNLSLTTTEQFTAKDLLDQRAHWEGLFSAKSMVKDTKWHKVIMHTLPTEVFNNQNGLKLLRDELELFNPGLKLVRDPIWLSTEENRMVKHHASAIIAFNTEEEARKALRCRLVAAGSSFRTSEYREYKASDQCQKCQSYGHLQNKCNKSSKCRYCAKDHLTWEHKCNQCMDKQPCMHTIPRCINCEKAHVANSPQCEFFRVNQPMSFSGDHLHGA